MDVGTHWIALFCNRNEIVYFDSFGVEYVPEEIKEFIDHCFLNSSTSYCPSSSASQNKYIIANIFQVQGNHLVMCGYFCIGFIDFILAGKKLTDYSSLFSLPDFKKNDSILLSYFKNK